jgi:hypothetical protein
VSSITFDNDAFTPLEARATARAVAGWLTREKFKVEIEAALDGAPYRTTLLARSAGLDFLVEAQGSPLLSAGLQELATWLAVQRKYAQFYIAIGATEDTSITGRMLDQMKKHGCGLLLVKDENVEVAFEASNPALIVTPDPTLQFGHCKKAVNDAVQRFNRGERKAGLRDMCELVERETNALARKLAHKGWIDKTEAIVEQMDFSNKINVLASGARYAGGRDPLVADRLKLDMHSFRGARNLVDHPVTSKREEIKREKQFPERMMMGPRLIAELVPLQRKVR